MAARLIEDDPELAHRHALSAARRAGRIAIVRETLAITAYLTGDYALALRELRTYRRISGSDNQIALMVDSERGVGRPERALELGRSVDRAALDTPVRVALAIAMSGARLDLGQNQEALDELQLPQLNPDLVFSWSPSLFDAYAETLEALGRESEAAVWRQRSLVAVEALDQSAADDEGETMVVVEEFLTEEELEALGHNFVEVGVEPEAPEAESEAVASEAADDSEPEAVESTEPAESTPDAIEADEVPAEAAPSEERSTGESTAVEEA
ncbi:hypothetical protein ACL9RL_11550 [Plantibacter sp. Mn2098]|uniref:hypothetical protein n=1 Tax=Plantibacter sp. Mn2098 TaxID=3395266 RepID=UPI003BDEB6B5